MTSHAAEPRPPVPPFTRDTAIRKARLAEDAWNSRDPQRVALAYAPDSAWRNRAEFLRGRAEIVAMLQRKPGWPPKLPRVWPLQNPPPERSGAGV